MSKSATTPEPVTVGERLTNARRALALAVAALQGVHHGDIRISAIDVDEAICRAIEDASEEVYWLSRLPVSILAKPVPYIDGYADGHPADQVGP